MAQEPDQVDLRRRVKENENPTPEEARERARRTTSADEVEATRAEIEQTRAELTETIDAIQERLDPRKLREEATARAKGTGSQAVEAIRQHAAVPLAVGGGLVGLILLRSLLRGTSGGGGGSHAQNVVIDLRTGRARTF